MFTKKQLFALLIPLMIEQILNSLMGTADTMMVSNAGSAAISAVSLVDSINILIIYVFSAMATGGTVVCAQYLGRGLKDKANDSAKQLVLSITVVSTVIAVFCIIFKGFLLNLIFGKVEADVMRNADIYFFITALSYPFIALYNSGAALFRVDGNSALPMKISVISNLLNIAGNAILIFGFKMGVAGAAIPTLVSRIVAAVSVMTFLRREKQTISVKNYFNIKPDFHEIFLILSIGVPTGIENGMFQLGKLAIQSTVSTMGTIAIAAQAMTIILELFTCNAAIGIGLGMVTVVGQCMGARKIDEAKKYMVKLTFYGFITVVLSCIIVALIVEPVTVLGAMEKEAAEMTIHLTGIICIVKPFLWPLAFMPVYGMRAAGDVKFPMIFSSISMWVFRVFVVIYLVRTYSMGPIAVWIGMFTDWSVRTIVFSFRLFSNRWAKYSVISENEA